MELTRPRLPRLKAKSPCPGTGRKFTIDETSDGIPLRSAESFPETDLDTVAGCLRYQGKSKTLAEMNAAVEREVARRHDRGRY